MVSSGSPRTGTAWRDLNSHFGEWMLLGGGTGLGRSLRLGVDSFFEVTSARNEGGVSAASLDLQR